jgi:hypothetical protein
MLVAFTALVFLLLGRELSIRLFPGDEASPIERACYAGVIGIALWLSTLWIAALLHVMVKGVLLARTAVAAVAVIVLVVRRSPRLTFGTQIRVAPATLIVLAFGILPVLLWCEFALWRGLILPPVSHDALAYHLPKAVLYVRAHGYDYFDFLDARIRNIPANYELLLSETMLLTGRDELTEWWSTFFYAFWVMCAAALAQRWWRSDWRTAVAVAIFAAGVPVALLHSGADKNDLMTASFMTAALLAAGRWIAQSDARAFFVLVPALAIAIGTKPQAGILAFALLPAVLWRFFRPRLQGKLLGAVAAGSIIAFLLLGGAVYVSNLVAANRLMGGSVGTEHDSVILYGDWSNLWQAPYVLLAAPFSRDPRALGVPWAETPWFWRRYEIFFSHLGIAFAICLALLPLAVLMQRHASVQDERSRLERLTITVAALLTLLVMLPVRFLPHGMYAISLPRYILFFVPIVFAWTIAPLAMRSVRHAVTLILAGGIFFCWYAVDNAVNDVFAPIEYVVWSRGNPNNRVVRFDPFRAAEIVDALAGPDDVVALDAGYGTWIHPLFGRDLRRRVDFIPAAEGPPTIGDDVKWVAIDRSWNSIWGDRRFTDLSQARQFLSRGKPSADELRVFKALREDSRFSLVFYNEGRNQAVFRRIGS